MIKTSIESIKMHFFSIIACRHENKEKMHVSKRQNEKPIKFLLQLDINPKSRACVSHDHIFIVIVVLET